MNTVKDTIAYAEEHNLHILIDWDIDINAYTGIIFYYAEWAPSILNLRVLFEEILKTPTVKICILDIDFMERYQYIFEQPGMKPNGWGEIYWMRNGKLLHSIKHVMRPNEYKNIEIWNKELLEE